MNHLSYDASPYSFLSETTVCSDVHSVKPCPLGLDSQTMRSLCELR